MPDEALKLVVLGAGGTAADALSIVDDLNSCRGQQYLVDALLDDDAARHGTLLAGIRIAGSTRRAVDLEGTGLINTLGSPRNPAIRERITHDLGLARERFISLIHPSVAVSRSARLGRGVILYPNVVIMANVTIGDQVIVLSGSVVNHDCTIGDFVTIASGANISGNVRIGPASYIGSGSAIIQNAVVGDHAIVGMGSVVLHDVAPGSVVAGNPAAPIRRTC